MEPEPLLGDLARILRAVDEGETRALVRAILDSEGVHLGGEGRSGLVMRAFAVRLAEAGFRTHVVGEATTPAFASGDLLVVCSGSARCASMVLAAERARSIGGRVGLLTATPLGPLNRLAQLKVLVPPVIPARTGGGEGRVLEGLPGEASLMQPVRALFSQACLILLDALVPQLMAATGQSEEDLEARRPNLS